MPKGLIISKKRKYKHARTIIYGFKGKNIMTVKKPMTSSKIISAGSSTSKLTTALSMIHTEAKTNNAIITPSSKNQR